MKKLLLVTTILLALYPLSMAYASLIQNIYTNIPEKQSSEKFESLLHDKNVVIQRIVSNGQVTSVQHPYDQKQDEWVMVLQGYAKLKIQTKGIIRLAKGDYYFIPKHTKHWVIYTSKTPKAIWLTVHIFNNPVPKLCNPK